MRRSRSSTGKEALVRVVTALAQRNYVRLLLDYAVAREAGGGRAGHEGLRAAEELGLPTLFWAIEVILGDALVRSTSPLAAVEADLDGLANSYAPIEAVKDDRLRSLLEKLPPPRRAAACSPRHAASPQEQAAVLALLTPR